MTALHALAFFVIVAVFVLPQSLGCSAIAGTRKPEIVAHRGESHDAPENTLAAVNLAWQRGAEAVEFDVHLTSDGKLITIHDKDTLRTTGGKEGGGVKHVVLEQTAEMLRKLDVGKWKSPQFHGEHMPLLEEVLATLPKEKHRRLFIEVKVGPDSVPPLIAAIKAAGRPLEQTCVISFNLETCAATKKALPELEVYYLSGFKRDKQTGEFTVTIDELIAQAKAANLDGLDVSHEGPLDAAAVKKVHDAGLKLYVYTIDDPAVAKRFVDMGVDGVTTNRAQWMRQQLGL